MGSILGRARALVHWRAIKEALEHYEERTGLDGDVPSAHPDVISFRVQLDRLFGLGGTPRRFASVASRTIDLAMGNAYYDVADLLSDIVDDLARPTFHGLSARGEPPMSSLLGDEAAESKTDLVARAWLVGPKIVSLEKLIAQGAAAFGGNLPLDQRARFEKALARAFSMLHDSEVRFVEERLEALIARWVEGDAMEGNAALPGEAMELLIAALTGKDLPDRCDGLRVRVEGLPVRLSTLQPNERQLLIRAALARLGAPGCAPPFSVPALDGQNERGVKAPEQVEPSGTAVSIVPADDDTPDLLQP